MARDTVSVRKRPALAKVTRPLNTQALPREQLFQKLDKLREHQVVWISSPAGSGKTTLISTYIQERGLPCLWYQVDIGDDDPATFFHYLGMAALNAVPRKRKEFTALSQEHLVSISAFTLRFFEDLCTHLTSPARKSQGGKDDTGFILVFDSCQEIPESSPFHTLLLNGLARIPIGINVILVSRVSPPPVYARLQANGLMGLLGWEDLRLSSEETARIIRDKKQQQLMGREAIESIHRITDGWAAGLTLLLGKMLRTGSLDEGIEGSTPEEIMHYFGSELFDNLDEATKDFLMKTSFLPIMTLEMASDLTGSKESGRILSFLYRNNYFTNKHFHLESSYEYHPLFREFLKDMARTVLPEAEIRATSAAASSVLEVGGQYEAAFELLREISDREAMARLIMDHAPQLMAHGRFRTLQEWLAAVPDHIMHAHPMLLYWKGAALQSSDPNSAKQAFEEAFASFSDAGDRGGMLSCLAGITESIQLSFTDLSQYDPWIPVIGDLCGSSEEIPNQELEARLIDGMVTALVLRRPDHPDIGAWVDRAASLLQGPISTTMKARLIHAVLFYAILQFDIERMNLAFDHLKITIRSKDIPPVTALFLHLMEANYHVMKANHEACLKAVDEGLSMARELDVHIMDRFFLCHAAMSFLNENNPSEARGYLEALALDYDHFSSWEKKAYHQVKARESLILGDSSQAYVHALRTLELIDELGLKVHSALGHYILSQALHLAGRHDEERDNIKESIKAARLIDQTTHMFYTTLLQSTCSFDLGDEESGQEHLKGAFSLGREHAHLGTYADIPADTARLCCRAIEAGIEPEYARWLVKNRRLTPDPPPYHLEGWPWPIKIYTLGRFAIYIDDNALSFPKKAQNKPLDVLKVIISGGGSNVADISVADTLWPDAEGDLAMQALATNLHRLRKLLGRNEAVLLQNGILSLDRNLCWIDARAFEYFLSRADTLWDKDPSEHDLDESCGLICSSIELYRGEFLPDDQWLPDVMVMREYLHSKFLKSLSRAGKHLVKTRRYDKAREAIEYGLDIDPCAEDFYQLLMICLQRQGHKAEALTVFERCKRTLQEELGTVPSADTEDLARSIRAGKTH